MSVGKHLDLGFRDAKGRKIGARVRLYTRGDDDPIEVEVWTTRDGEVFGREPKSRRADNVVKAKAIAARWIESLRKRYTKRARLLAEGCHARWTDRKTGATMTLRDAGDMDVDERYLVVCEEHATILGVPSKAAGRRTSGLDFCDDCRDAKGSR